MSNVEKYDINSPEQLQEFSGKLKDFIVKRGLYTEISGKNYVNIEGWQFAGAATGIVPVITKVTRVETEDDEIKYKAEVVLKSVKTDQTVGSGMAICSNKEYKKGDKDEYVIASMAQTRAIGKAYRNIFAWLMKMAGYEATPSEEMDATNNKTK